MRKSPYLQEKCKYGLYFHAHRNLTKSQLVAAWSKYEEEVAREAKERQSEAGGDRKSENAKSLRKNFNEPIEPIRTAAEVAAKICVGHS